MKRSLTRDERLKKRSDLQRVFDGGARRNCKGARLIFIRNGLDRNRFAVCPVRKYGTAVERNRGKRLCREVYRTMKGCIRCGFDLVFVIYPGHDNLRERKTQFSNLVRQAGIENTE